MTESEVTGCRCAPERYRHGPQGVARVADPPTGAGLSQNGNVYRVSEPSSDGSAAAPHAGPSSRRLAWFLVGATPWVIFSASREVDQPTLLRSACTITQRAGGQVDACSNGCPFKTPAAFKRWSCHQTTTRGRRRSHKPTGLRIG
jgi:hypothetical protein